MLAALRHPGYAGQQRRLPGHGQPLASSRSTGCQPVCLPRFFAGRLRRHYHTPGSRL